MVQSYTSDICTCVIFQICRLANDCIVFVSSFFVLVFPKLYRVQLAKDELTIKILVIKIKIFILHCKHDHTGKIVIETHVGEVIKPQKGDTMNRMTKTVTGHQIQDE